MAGSKLNSWKMPIIVLVFVCLGVVGFFVAHFWVSGQLTEPEILDLSLVRSMQTNGHHEQLHPTQEEPNHYDFFSLLEQPVPVRALPDIALEQNPAIAAKARRSLGKINGKFAIQVSSFRNASDAQTLVRQLNVQGYHAVVVSEKIKGQGWYRVRIDGGNKRESAENLLANVEKKTGMKGIVVSL